MSKQKPTQPSKKDTTSKQICWWCQQSGATIRTEPQPPDNEAWWFHPKCYLKLQELLD